MPDGAAPPPQRPQKGTTTMAMGLFNRRKDEGPTTESTTPGAAAPAPGSAPGSSPGSSTVREAEYGVPSYRSHSKEASMATATKSGVSAMPAIPTLPNGGTPRPANVGVPARPAPRTDPAERRTLVVGRGISLQGTVADAERLVVEGTVESQMINAAELFVAASGVFKGEVEVEDAEIHGVFDGTITARGSLTIRANGRIAGVARYRRIAVEEGGQITGRMEMLNDNAPPARGHGPHGLDGDG